MEAQPSIVPVPIIPADSTFSYVAIKGSLHAQDSAIFGLNKDEVLALSKRFSNSSTEILNGIIIKGHPIAIINSLAELGYRVISTTGEAEIVWTLQREI